MNQSIEQSEKLEQSYGAPNGAELKNMREEELLERLNCVGVKLEKEEMQALLQNAASVTELAQQLWQRFNLSEMGFARDWVYGCTLELWTRWQSDRPCPELVFDLISEGISCEANKDEKAACDLWLKAWQAMQLIIKKENLSTLAEFEEKYDSPYCFLEWLDGFTSNLWSVGLDFPEYQHQRIDLCNEILALIEDDELTRENMQRCLAESIFEIGEQEKAIQKYDEWLAADPMWGWGWIGFADLYIFSQKFQKDYLKAEEILKKGLAIAGVRDRDDILERMSNIYDRTGRKDEAEQIRAQIREREQAKRKTLNHGESKSEISLEAVAAALKNLRMDKKHAGPSPAVSAASKPKKQGRNDLCLCGSNKKFKKCCGRKIFG